MLGDKAFEEFSTELGDRNNRKQDIIMIGVPESDTYYANTRKSQELGIVQAVLEALPSGIIIDHIEVHPHLRSERRNGSIPQSALMRMQEPVIGIAKTHQRFIVGRNALANIRPNIKNITMDAHHLMVKWMLPNVLPMMKVTEVPHRSQIMENPEMTAESETFSWWRCGGGGGADGGRGEEDEKRHRERNGGEGGKVLRELGQKLKRLHTALRSNYLA
ncbi:hypothetical protein Trydic_g19592 [Trypoxylus dichotomus]